MKNFENVKFFIQYLQYILKSIGNEKKLDRKPTVDEPVNPIERLKNFVNKKHPAYELTPKSSIDVKYLEPQECFSRQSPSQTGYQTDPDN